VYATRISCSADARWVGLLHGAEMTRISVARPGRRPGASQSDGTNSVFENADGSIPAILDVPPAEHPCDGGVMVGFVVMA